MLKFFSGIIFEKLYSHVNDNCIPKKKLMKDSLNFFIVPWIRDMEPLVTYNYCCRIYFIIYYEFSSSKTKTKINLHENPISCSLVYQKNLFLLFY